MALKHRAVGLALKAGLSIGKVTDPSRVRTLIGTLHPVETALPLIRIGADGDGGYLLPDDLDGIDGCFSPGVSLWAQFEEALLGRGIPCFMADASVNRSPIAGGVFISKYLGVVADADTIRLDDWVAQYAPGAGDLLLQMDIEGAEWPVLLDVSDAVLRRFRIIVVEFHDLERVFDRHAFDIINGVLSRLVRDFHVVHIHPNNYGGAVRGQGLVIPRVLEMTFLRADRAEPTSFAQQFPHPLDITNNPGAPDIVLPDVWRHAPADAVDG